MSVNTCVKKFFFLVLLLFSIGCAPTQSSNIVTNHVVGRDEIETLISDQAKNTSNYFITDDAYALPSEKWIHGAFSASYSDLLMQINSSRWVSQENDCDNFSLAASFWAKVLHHGTKNKIKNQGIAFGEFYYAKDGGAGLHAINFAVVKDAAKYKLLFYEPQTKKIISLSKEEVESCVFWRL